MAKENHKSQDANDLIVAALMKIRRDRAQEQIEKLEKFSSIGDIMTYLANASTKERADFLKPWTTENAAEGVGRKKNDDFGIYGKFMYVKERLGNKSNRRTMELIIQQGASGLPESKRTRHIDKLRKQAPAFLTRISKIHVLFKKPS